jgi:hypothetical protein
MEVRASPRGRRRRREEKERRWGKERRGEGKREERREMRADRWGLTATWVPCHQNCFMAKYVWF